jgi:integrase
LRNGTAIATSGGHLHDPVPHPPRHVRPGYRHRHLLGARIGEQVGHDDITTTSRVYTHVVADENELDYAGLLA